MAFPNRWFSPLSLIILAIMVAASALGYFSYHAANRIAARSEESVESSNRLIGLKLIDRIEKVIIDSDRTLFWMVRLDDPREFKELWRRIVSISPVVDTVIVLDEKREVIHFVSQLPPPALQHFRRLFSQIVRDMELKSLPPYTHKHLHKYYGQSPYLISYIRQRSGGRDYYIALNMNLPYLTNDIFREEFRELVDTHHIAVRDEAGRAIYGNPAPVGGPFSFEERFPTTFYLWRLQIAPREVKSIRSEARAQRTYNIVLVGIAVAVIVFGMMVLFVAVRKERRLNELKSEFISNVTHELKTPLTLIRMFGELLGLGRTAADGTTSREYAEIIMRESDRLTRLIDNVLDFARIERGKAAYNFSTGSVQTVVERVVDLCHYRAEQAGISLTTAIAPDLPETRLDEDAMTLLLFNLVENAIKYGGHGEVVVALRHDPEGRQVLLRVSDQGPGIPREEHGRIFERFYRAKAARSGGSVRGSGIGLSLVKHIAEAHGGRVRIESELGKGSTFEVTIPVRPTQAAALGDHEERRQAGSSDRG
jgi:two-component system phosphate regulon sensor histidine kinase PhoR